MSRFFLELSRLAQEESGPVVRAQQEELIASLYERRAQQDELLASMYERRSPYFTYDNNSSIYRRPPIAQMPPASPSMAPPALEQGVIISTAGKKQDGPDAKGKEQPGMWARSAKQKKGWVAIDKIIDGPDAQGNFLVVFNYQGHDDEWVEPKNISKDALDSYDSQA